MIIDFEKSELPDDLCKGAVVIAGFGPVGMALATGLRRRGRKVVVFESGGRDARGSHPYSVSVVSGLPFTGADQRARGLGGNSVLWAGQCMRFSDMDFRARAWVPGSGWPDTFGRLESEYATAEQWLGVRGVGGGASLLRNFQIEPAHLYSKDWEVQPSVFNPQSDLMRMYREVYKRDSNLAVVYNATVTDVERQQGAVSGCRVTSPNGKTQAFEVQQLVLAMGAIEVARFLLTPRRDFPNGIGNEFGQVGAHFQDHPNGPVADFAVTNAESELLLRWFSVHRQHRMRVLPKLALSADRQIREQVLNAAVMPVFEWNESSLTEDLRQMQRAIAGRRFDGSLLRNVARSAKRPRLVARMLGARMHGRVHVEPPSRVRLHLFTEQAPEGSSAISLDPSRVDRFGLPMARVRWRVGELEEATMKVAVERARTYFSVRKLGTVGSVYGSMTSLVSDGRMKDNQHHAGTARLGVDPKRSVVDTELRVHALDNLYVVGGAVFPTSSYANPTLTMCALAFRLSDRMPGPSAGEPR